MGVDVLNEDIADNFAACVWEPAIVKANAITAASEATCLLLSVDETVKNPRSGQGKAHVILLFLSLLLERKISRKFLTNHLILAFVTTILIYCKMSHLIKEVTV